MSEWGNRPLEAGLSGAVHRRGARQGARRVGHQCPIYVAVGVTVHGERDILGLWVGDGAEGAKFWLAVLTEIRNRGVAEVCIVVCDGLKGLPDSVNAVFPAAIVQTCIIHLIRGTFRYASRKYWDELARDLKPVYTAPTAAAAEAALEMVEEKWGARYPAISRLWRGAWTEFVPFEGLRRRDPLRSSARRTPSSPSTPGSAARYGPGATSPTSSPR